MVSKITFNKIFFVCILIFDIFYAVMYTYWKVTPYHIHLIFFGVVIGFKYNFYLICYKTINRKNVNMSITSVMLSLLYEAAFYILFPGGFIKLILLFVFLPMSLIIKTCVIISIYMFKSLLYFDINIPVNGYEIGRKVDRLADSIPGL